MVVNSITFWLFFSIVTIPYYYLLKKESYQNLWLLASSWFFYGWVDWKMIPLLIIVTISFYGIGILIKKNNHVAPKKASRLTTLGVLLGLGVLFYFKYFNFFVNEFAALFRSFGLQINDRDFHIIMPIGVSFFTFKLISYLIEIHRENIDPTNDFVKFATYVSFFPTILSGPIDRPGTFIPQLNVKRTIQTAQLSEGFKRILWGMFLKMCVADIIAPWTDAVLNSYIHHNTTSILIASFLYLIQLYTDFCGFSEMAIGVSLILGLKVTENFHRPFFAKNAAEYWRRWHMSLTTWITDYVFMTLNVAMRDWGKWGLYLATLINLVVIGVWHGANWTFFWFGFYHGIILILVMMVEKKRKKFEKKHTLSKNELYIWLRRGLTIVIFTFGSVLFRAQSIGDFLGTLSQLGTGFGLPYEEELPAIILFAMPSFLLVFFREWVAEYKRDIHFFHSKNVLVRIASIAMMIALIIYIGQLDGNSFIYFQF